MSALQGEACAMYEEAWSAIERELGKDEKLLWAGQPRQGFTLRTGDAFLIPFSVMWGGFAIFWEVMALTGIPKGEQAPVAIKILFPLFGIPFVLVGLYLIFGRFIVDARMRAKTYYGLTNRRVIIVSGLLNRQVQSLDLKGLNEITLSEKNDMSGTIMFGTNPFGIMLMGPTWPGTRSRLAPSFDLIANVRDVYNLIRDAQVKEV